MTIKVTDTEILGASGSFPNFRNRLLNGNFWINQLALSGTRTLAAGQYGHDGWYGGPAGCQYSFVTVGLDTTITILSGSLMQTVGADYNEGGAHVLSWAGTAVGRFQGGAYGVSPQTAGALAVATQVTVEFAGGTLGLVQLEPGLTPRVFDRKEPRTELRRAKRYFRHTFPEGIAPGTTGYYPSAARGIAIDANNVVPFMTLDEPMASTPTFSVINPATGAGNTLRVTATGAAATHNPSSMIASREGIYSLVSSGAYTPGTIYDFHYIASARL